MWTLDIKESALQSAAALNQPAVPSEPSDSYNALTFDAVPCDDVKYTVPIEDASQCRECTPSNAVVQQDDVSVKTEPMDVAMTTNDSLLAKANIELQHRSDHRDNELQKEVPVTDTVLRHEDQRTDAVLQQHYSILSYDEDKQQAMLSIDELKQEASPDGSVLWNEVAANDSLLSAASDGDSSALQRDIQIFDGNRGLEDREISAGIVKSDVEVGSLDHMDSELSASERDEVGLKDAGTNAAAAADVAAADARLEVAEKVDRDVADDDNSLLDRASDRSTESPAICDNVGKPRDFVPAESSPRTIAHGCDTSGIHDSQDAAHQHSLSAYPEVTDECSDFDKGDVTSLLLCLLSPTLANIFFAVSLSVRIE